MSRFTMLPTGLVMALLASTAWSQTKVGQLLDSNATKLTAEEFRQQIVDQVVEGPGRSGAGSIEIKYLRSGVIRGSGSAMGLGVGGGAMAGGASWSIEGTWTIDDRGRVCESSQAGSVVLAPRCQWWFQQSGKYFITDSDWDRSAQATPRTIKKM